MTQPTTPCNCDLLAYIRERLELCIRLIDGIAGPDEHRALVWVLGEEFAAIMGRLWRGLR